MELNRSSIVALGLVVLVAIGLSIGNAESNGAPPPFKSVYSVTVNVTSVLNEENVLFAECETGDHVTGGGWSIDEGFTWLTTAGDYRLIANEPFVNASGVEGWWLDWAPGGTGDPPVFNVTAICISRTA